MMTQTTTIKRGQTQRKLHPRREQRLWPTECLSWWSMKRRGRLKSVSLKPLRCCMHHSFRVQGRRPQCRQGLCPQGSSGRYLDARTCAFVSAELHAR